MSVCCAVVCIFDVSLRRLAYGALVCFAPKQAQPRAKEAD